jgi:hypothetical protein
LTVGEADPQPPRGPERDQMVAANEHRSEYNETLITAVVVAYLARTLGVTLSRLRGPTARKGTRFWDGEGAGARPLDATFVLPDKLVRELDDQLTRIFRRIAESAAADIASRIDGSDHDLVPYSVVELGDAVTFAVARVMVTAQRYAEEVRQAIDDAEHAHEADLDAVVERVEAAHRRGGAWLSTSARTIGFSLSNEAMHREAVRRGATHHQWVTRHDGHVRASHITADGQVREIANQFDVGRFHLLHPGDPSELPASWAEIANCRCGVSFGVPNADTERMFTLMRSQRHNSAAPGNTATALAVAVAAAADNPDGATLTPTPQGYPDLPPVATLVSAPTHLVGYRVLDGAPPVTPGQWLTTAGQLVLGMAPPTSAAAILLTVLIPAGATIGVAGGAMLLPGDVPLDVLGAGIDGIRAQAVTP